MFRGLEYNVSIDSTLDGITPGTVWADDLDHPHTALIQTVEGWALGGDPQDGQQVARWADLVRDDLFKSDQGEEIDLRVTPLWETWIEELAAGIQRETIRWPRRHYVCHQLAFTDWANRLPARMSVQPIDDALLGRADRGDLKVPAHTIGWTENNWATRQDYLARGFGFCVVDEAADEVVSWSVADCASGDRCEIGIHTLPAYQRRGLGSITSAAAVDHALRHGFNEVGWHCDEHNPGSIGTAEKVGFVLERRYRAYVYKGDPGDHHTLRAYRALLDGNLQASITEFQKAFAIRDDYPFWIYFHTARAYAALEQSEAAFDALKRAADLGEHRMAMLAETQEFNRLHNQPRWQAVLASIEANSRLKAEDER